VGTQAHSSFNQEGKSSSGRVALRATLLVTTAAQYAWACGRSISGDQAHWVRSCIRIVQSVTETNAELHAQVVGFVYARPW